MSFIKSSVTETLCDLLCINELCPFVFLCLPIRHHHHLICQHMENIWQIQASDEHEINRNRMVKLCNSARVCHQLYCIEMLINVYLQYGEVPDNVNAVGPRAYGVKEEMVSIFHVLINRPIKIDLGNNGDDHRRKLETKNTHNQKRTVYQKCWISEGVDT